MCLVVEGSAFLGLTVLDKGLNRRYDPNPSTLSESQKTNLRAFLKRGHGEYVGMDPVLGWTPPPPEVNAAGMRDDRDYETAPRPGTVRISAFGDSFTYGADVALAETWEKQMVALSPSAEVLNYGVGAYGLDQAYLRYLQVGADYHPHVVLIGYMSENLARDVNVFRGFYTNMYRDTIFTKPRFRVTGGQLTLLRNPLETLDDYDRFLRDDVRVLAELGQNDYHYQVHYNAGRFDMFSSVRLGKMAWAQFNQRALHPIFTLSGMYDPGSEAYEVTVKIFDAFYQRVLDDGAVPVIVVFPDLNDQHRSRLGKPRRYTPLLEDFRSRGYRCLDVMDALEPYESRYRVDELSSLQWGHYSPLGNAIVAKYLWSRLSAWNLVKAPEPSAPARQGIAAGGR